ncbi:MAG: response regulator transcription factor [Acidobacteriaceae bacterium]|nr:response regulator transcription factor [Acidobacteriaceae bacterium]MBV9308552.1 response regulator transcription factor [Acidobacteriaceae bacterium]
MEIASEAQDGEEALVAIRNVSPDLLFLDIQMPGMSGFDVLDRLDTNIPDVISTTAFDQHALRAFEVNALDYLLKPIAPERLAVALSRVMPRSSRRLSQVFVRDGDHCWIVRVRDILLESEGNYTRLYFREAHPLVRRSLNTLEQQLDPDVFFRANRKQIFNLNSIQKTTISVNGGVSATFPQGKLIELSRRQSDLLKQLMSSSSHAAGF